MAATAEPKHQSRRSPVTADQVLAVLRERGGAARRSTIAHALDTPDYTVARRLAALIADGRLERDGHGAYRLPGGLDAASLPPTATEILEAIEQSGTEAHLTGFDVLGSHSHQFVRSFPHLVNVDPAGLEQLAFHLSQAGFLPVPAGRAARNTIVHAPNLDRIVVLRTQPPARMDRFGVRSGVGPPEKAWLDLLRETRTGLLPLSLGDVGAVLASLLRAGGDERQLRTWAREMGYSRQVAAVLDPVSAADAEDPELRTLAAGAIR